MIGPKSFIQFNGGSSRQYINLREEILDAMDKVMVSGQTLNGEYILAFEDEMARRTGRKYAIAVNSCTNAIHYVLDYINYQSQNHKPKIAIPNFSFKSTENTSNNHGNSVLIDVDQYTGLMNLSELGDIIKEVDIIMYVNIYGNMINYQELTVLIELFCGENKPMVIEDAAQSFGATYQGQPSGSFGDHSVISFDPTKNLSSAGGGGMILTDNETDASYLRRFVHNDFPGAVNSSMSENDCAAMMVKLKYFDAWQERRGQIAKYYSDNLHESILTPDQTITENATHSWHKYVIISNRRDTIKHYLLYHGVGSKIHYTPDLSMSPATGANFLAGNVLSLPIYPELTDSEVEYIVDKVNEPLTKNSKLSNPDITGYSNL